MQKIFWDIQYVFNTLKYLSLSKIQNSCYLTFSYFISISKIAMHQRVKPTFLSIEVTNYCNLHCPECPVGIQKNKKTENKKFNLSVFKKIIDELKPTLQHVILYFQGEPMLNNQLSEFIEYAHKSKIFTSTSTNGQLLNKDNAKNLVVSGLDKLIISVDGTTQETYSRYRVGGNLEKTLEGIKNINFWKNELKSLTPFVEIQFLVLKTNEHQMADMKELAKKMKVERLTFKTAQLYDFENGNELMTSKNQFSRYKKGKDEKFRIKGHQPNRCWRLWTGAVINVNGDVLPCCFDKSSEHSFGNITENSFSECWNSNNASNFRRKILTNRKQFEMCRNCTE
jgi:radical SAM protein with 4Fe4S-binding SPASM domain